MKKKFPWLLLCVLALNILHPACVVGIEPQKTYTSAAFGFTLAVPGGYDSMQEADNGDGIRVAYPSGMNLAAYGSRSPGVLGESLDEVLAQKQSAAMQVTYKRVNKTEGWFVISGHEGENIFYFKFFVGQECLNALEITYPRQAADQFDASVKNMVGSFKPGPLN